MVSSMTNLRESIFKALSNVTGYQRRKKAFLTVRERVESLVRANPSLSKQVRKSKFQALENLDELMRVAISSLEGAGFTVFVAESPEEASHYITQLINEGPVIKSKSNAVKETGVIEAITARGIDVIETDLGDRINQLAGLKATHPITPAMEVSKEEARFLFEKETGRTLDEDISATVFAARGALREIFLRAPVSISGANAIAAEEGVVLIAENEGNIRLLSTLPKVHIIVAGVEKLVRNLDDALTVVQGAATYGTGVNLTTYVSAVSGPRTAEGITWGNPRFSGPKEVHLVLLAGEKRRRAVREFPEAMACLNCGSCLNYCPLYSVLGAAYGEHRYGGIGAVRDSLLEENGPETTFHLNLCIQCKRCKSVCPVEIDTPALTNRLMAVKGYRRLRSLTERLVLFAVARPRLFRIGLAMLWLVQRCGCLDLVRKALPPGKLKLQLDRIPQVPPPQEWFKTGSFGINQGKSQRVIFFPGCIMSTLLGPATRATLRVLLHQGVEVICPDGLVCCGAMHHHSGEEEKAKAMARHNLSILGKVKDFDRIVMNSAGCAIMVKDYGDLFKDEPAFCDLARTVSEKTVEFSEFLAETGLATELGPVKERIVFQESCQLRFGQETWAKPMALLDQIPGLEVKDFKHPEACCGSGGLYSMRLPEISDTLGTILVEEMLAADATAVVSLNPGCIMHMKHILRNRAADLPVLHLAELLDRSLDRTEARIGVKMP